MPDWTFCGTILSNKVIVEGNVNRERSVLYAHFESLKGSNGLGVAQGDDCIHRCIYRLSPYELTVLIVSR